MFSADRCLVSAILLAMLCSSPTDVSARRQAPMVVINLTITDDHGEPVPYVTVGSSWTPFGRRSTALVPEDGWRVFQRYPETWEYCNEYVAPLPSLMFGMSNASGAAIEKINEDDFGDAPVPDTLTVAYVIYRRGYEPARETTVIKKGDRRVDLNVVLKRAPDYEPNEKPYVRTLYEVRYEISDSRANAEMSKKNQRRLEKLRKRLEEAAQQAIDAIDGPAAARILYWVAHMPEVLEMDGKIYGYAQTNIKSPRNIAALQKAAELDPENHHLQSMWLVQLNDIVMHQRYETREEWIAEKWRWLDQALRLDKRAHGKLWPEFYSDIAHSYGFLRDYESNYKALLWLQQYEPKFRDYHDQITVAKRQMEEQQAGRK